jgi:hyperosmotically inducible protein
MLTKKILAAMAAMTLLVASGCSVARDQQTAGAYMDDAAITTAVKGKLAKSPDAAATSISVETLNGTVMLSGFAKNATEKSTAESLAREVDGVTSVKNQIVIKP